MIANLNHRKLSEGKTLHDIISWFHGVTTDFSEAMIVGIALALCDTLGITKSEIAYDSLTPETRQVALQTLAPHHRGYLIRREFLPIHPYCHGKILVASSMPCRRCNVTSFPPLTVEHSVLCVEELKCEEWIRPRTRAQPARRTDCLHQQELRRKQ